MLKRQRNLVFETLKENCNKHLLNLDDFSFEEGTVEHEYAIIYRGSDWRYRLTKKERRKYLIEYKPAATDSLIFSIESFTYEFSDTVLRIDDWIEALVYEKDAPDLWNEFSGTQNTGALETTDNEPLTPEEQSGTLQAIENVKTHILELESDGGEVKKELKAHIDDQFAHLEDAVTRVGKKDYILMFQATVFNTVTSWMLSPENRSAIWLFAMEQIRIQLIPDMVIPGLPN